MTRYREYVQAAPPEGADLGQTAEDEANDDEEVAPGGQGTIVEGGGGGDAPEQSQTASPAANERASTAGNGDGRVESNVREGAQESRESHTAEPGGRGNTQQARRPPKPRPRAKKQLVIPDWADQWTRELLGKMKESDRRKEIERMMEVDPDDFEAMREYNVMRNKLMALYFVGSPPIPSKSGQASSTTCPKAPADDAEDYQPSDTDDPRPDASQRSIPRTRSQRQRLQAANSNDTPTPSLPPNATSTSISLPTSESDETSPTAPAQSPAQTAHHGSPPPGEGNMLPSAHEPDAEDDNRPAEQPDKDIQVDEELDRDDTDVQPSNDHEQVPAAEQVRPALLVLHDIPDDADWISTLR